MSRSRPAAPSSYDDQLRAQAAATAACAEVNGILERLDSVTDTGLALSELCAQVLRSARFVPADQLGAGASV